jgi:hypothetical protein
MAVATTSSVPELARRLQMPKDLLYLNRITIGASSILGHLRATADWKAIDAESRHHGPPATDWGHQEAAWRARRSNTAGRGGTVSLGEAAGFSRLGRPTPGTTLGNPAPFDGSGVGLPGYNVR